MKCLVKIWIHGKTLQDYTGKNHCKNLPGLALFHDTGFAPD